MTATGQPTVTYFYDNANRLTQINQGTSTVTMAYDAANRRTSLTLPNGLRVDYSYDAASRLTGLTYRQGATVIGELTYTYDKAGRRIKTGGSYARTGLPQPLTSASYNAAHRMLSFGAETLSYDLNGNLTSDGTDSFIWDARNRLASMSGPGLTASFTYDPLGRRVQKTVNSQSQEFLYDDLNMGQELAGASVQASMLSGLGMDEVFSRTDAAGTNSFLTDALGSTVALTDAAGTVQTEYTYAPFGETSVTGAASTNPFQFTGRENEGTTALYYYRARYYHPVLQRFISEDPIEFAGSSSNILGYYSADVIGIEDDESEFHDYESEEQRSFFNGDLNLYGYVLNDPINFVDPEGTIRIPPGVIRFLRNFRFDGPSAGFRQHRRGRVCQIRYKNLPLFRLDYDSVPGSGGAPRLHYHRAPDIGKHRPYEGGW